MNYELINSKSCATSNNVTLNIVTLICVVLLFLYTFTVYMSRLWQVIAMVYLKSKESKPSVLVDGVVIVVVVFTDNNTNLWSV